MILKIFSPGISMATVMLTIITGSISHSAIAKGNRWALPQPVASGDFHSSDDTNPNKIKLGQMLFFDKILSGNRNISCATCHHPMTWTGDGLALPIGEGGRGLGIMRNNGEGAEAVHERVPRNAPALFNLGATEFVFQFHDGRVGIDPAQPSGFSSPAGEQLPTGLDNVLAVQAMFPVTSPAEMAGQAGENPVADAAANQWLAGPGGVWNLLAQRLQSIPAYVELFKLAYPDDVLSVSDITFVQAANAIAAFEATAFRADNSPFDRYLRGDRRAMSKAARKGMALFYGKLGCSTCHSGKFQTDHAFHAIAVPQIGPGKGDNQEGYRDGRDDFGREQVTGDPADRFKFRTPSLRNIALTAPYGHDGAYNTLEAMVRHHLNPVESLYQYDQIQAALCPRDDLNALDFVVMNDPNRIKAIAAANELRPRRVKDSQISYLLEFLRALTDPNSLDLRSNAPFRVPSGLPVTD